MQVARVEPRYKRNGLVGGSTKSAQTHKTPLSNGVAFCVPALVTGLPANYGQWLDPLRLSQAVSAGLPTVWAASLADALAERLLFLRAGRNFPSSRYITGTLSIAIPVPFLLAFKMRGLNRCLLLRSLQSRNPAGVTLQKTVDCRLPLTLCAVMRAASRHNDSADQAAAIATRLTGALVNAMLKLEESAYTFGVDVVGDGRASEADGVFQNFPQRHAQSLQFSPGELSGSASWAKAGA